MPLVNLFFNQLTALLLMHIFCITIFRLQQHNFQRTLNLRLRKEMAFVRGNHCNSEYDQCHAVHQQNTRHNRSLFMTELNLGICNG